MTAYLFDTMAHAAAMSGMPEKWRRAWKEVTIGHKSLILLEPLVAEMTSKLSPRIGIARARQRILWLKSLRNTSVVSPDDNEAIEAGFAKMRYKAAGLSLVDAFILTIARRQGAKVFTTDRGLRDTCRESKVEVDFLPLEELSSE